MLKTIWTLPILSSNLVWSCHPSSQTHRRWRSTLTHPLQSCQMQRLRKVCTLNLDNPEPCQDQQAIEIKKRFRQYSLPSIAATWHDCMASDSPNDETLLASPAQGSEWSFIASSQLGKGNVRFDSFSSPPGQAASDAISFTPTEDTEPDDTEADI